MRAEHATRNVAHRWESVAAVSLTRVNLTRLVRTRIGCRLGRGAEYVNQAGCAVDSQQVACANAAGTVAGVDHAGDCELASYDGGVAECATDIDDQAA
jgi:hypothetical protein